MRILMIHPHDIHSSVEPWTRRIKSLASELVKDNHEVKLIYFPLSHSENSAPHRWDGYEVIPLNRYPSPLFFIKNTLELIKLGRWADIIHFQKCQHYASLPAVIAAYFNQKRLHYDWDDWEEMIWYESCGESLHSKFIGISFRALERLLPILSDTVSVASEYLRNLALAYGVNKNNIVLAPVGADLEKFNPHIDGKEIRRAYDIRGPLILYIGQLHGAQYIDLFISAANIVLHRRPEAIFMIVGEGFMEGSLKKACYRLGIENKIIFTGSVPHHKVPEYIAAADLCVAPFRDTKVTRCKSPLKIVEYMAMGKAIVASNVGEVRRMLGGAGLLVEPGSAHSLSEGILRMMDDGPLREHLGKFARQRAERKYNWQTTARNLSSAFSQRKK